MVAEVSAFTELLFWKGFAIGSSKTKVKSKQSTVKIAVFFFMFLPSLYLARFFLPVGCFHVTPIKGLRHELTQIRS
jgi:hypothetical protein